ncbi:MAG: MarR family winged helix-turn-helix transcriptional regulator [Actinobacteria bacterium]|nr:MarR family winged helix-turn-helix transcriptional regulator [Actinomycetota bacterium]
MVEDLARGEVVEEVNPVLAPLALAFKRMVGVVERESGVNGLKWFVLTRLAGRDGLSQGEVSRFYEIDPSRVTRTAQAMENEGLISRERDPEDNRVVRMYLTGEGRTLLRRLPDLNEHLGHRIHAVLNEEELVELQRMLVVLAEAMKD